MFAFTDTNFGMIPFTFIRANYNSNELLWDAPKNSLKDL